jgi:hypothetical protein
MHTITATPASNMEALGYATIECRPDQTQYIKVTFAGGSSTLIEPVARDVALPELEFLRLRLPQDWEMHFSLDSRDGRYIDPISDAPFSGFWKITYFDDDSYDVLILRGGLIVDKRVVGKALDGEWKEAFPNDLFPDGIETMYYPSGRRSHQTQYLNGVRHGLALAWQPDGSIALKECFRDGIKRPLSECQ